MESSRRATRFTLPLIAVLCLSSPGCGGPTTAAPGEVALEGTVLDVNDARPRDGGLVIKLRKMDWTTVILWVGSPCADPPPPPLSEDLEKSLLALHTGDRVRATGHPGDGNLELTGLEILD